MTCQICDFYERALAVQRARLPGTVTTVLMLERERSRHRGACDRLAVAS